MAAAAEPVHEVPNWLKTLPTAPEFHPTLAEFQDPISYILKIEKQASAYGICKIVPPVPLPSKKTTLTNLNRSISAKNPKSLPTFTTRHQQIGFDPRKGRPVQKPVWQSGEEYTLQEFEAKAKLFEKMFLKRCGKNGKKGDLSALEIETLFWRASVDKPFSVEYANDMPGSAFPQLDTKQPREGWEAATVGETAWNMRGVARSKGSLLRFMEQEIPGVTSPMVYIAMLFSWFAWHVEDHDFHSLNYMHMGAAKTWYGVPKDAAFAFQEVVRVHGYGGDFNPIVTFATLGEKTTVMSPEVLIDAGIPCCRLVQNVGEFVVTFPGAYHSGFSHGFNCAEASNIATPEWLRFAKEAAIRRASINCPPMVSHFQLLYALALALCSSAPMSISSEPRSLRLKDKKRGEGEGIVKESFVQSVIQNNELLHVLSSHGYPCVYLPQNSSEIYIPSHRCSGTQKKVRHRTSLGLGSNNEASEASTSLLSNENKLQRDVLLRQLIGFNAVNETSNSVSMGDRSSSLSVKHDHPSNSVIVDIDKRENSTPRYAGLLEQERFACVQCGILSYACAAVVEPKKAAAQYFMSADCSIFNEWKAGSRVPKDESIVPTNNEAMLEPDCTSGTLENVYQDGLYDVPVQSGDYQIQVSEQIVDVCSHTEAQNGVSSLDLLAFAYGNSSDSDEELVEAVMVVKTDNIRSLEMSGEAHASSPRGRLYDDSKLHSRDPDHEDNTSRSISHSSSKSACADEVSVQVTQCTNYSQRKRKWTNSDVHDKTQQDSDCSLEVAMEITGPMKLKHLEDSYRDNGVLSERIITGSAEINETDLYINHIESDPTDSIVPSNSFPPRSKVSQAVFIDETTSYSNTGMSIHSTCMPFMQISKDESSRKHIFCLEHAVEVEKQLRPIGGANILLLCHPEYPKVEAEAKSLAPDLGVDHLWKDILYREASKEDQERISLAIIDEEADPSNGDWAVKLGINLYYSVHLSKSPLYTKQMPYNAIIYKAFGCSSTNYPMELKYSGKLPNKQKKIVVAGKWCGKVWMSNQVHPYLAHRETEEDHIRRTPCLRERPMLERQGLSNQISEVAVSERRSSPGVITTIARKPGQKKTTIGKAATKKHKSPDWESPDQTADESSGSDSSLSSRGRSLRNRQSNRDKSLPLHSRVNNVRQYDSNSKIKIEGGHAIGRKLGQKKTKIGKAATKKQNSPELETPAQTEEDSSGSDSPSSSHGRSFRNGQTKQERSLPLRTRVKMRQYDLNSKVKTEGGLAVNGKIRHKKTNIGKEGAKKHELHQLESPSQTEEDSSGSGSSLSSNGRFLKNGQTKHARPLLQCSNLKKCRQYDSNSKDEIEGGPSTRLRKRPLKLVDEEVKPVALKRTRMNKAKKALPNKNDIKNEESEYQCDLDGCTMGFSTKQELVLHKRNICSVKGCGKKFFSHKYLVQHRRVHMDDRPLLCPWKGCKMTFKWAWARTEHIRVHTGDRPYVCGEKGCGQTFRFVSDFSRHKRKTGHVVKSKG